MDYRIVSLAFLIVLIGGLFQFTGINQEIMNNADREIPDDTPEYGLNLQSFSIGGDEGKLENESPSMTFRINNSKHGLKGIEAENISYRIGLKPEDSEVCETGWKHVADSLDPGESEKIDASEIYNSQLEACDLNNTELSKANLDLRYSYYAQASLKSSIAEKAENRTVKRSESANTIVKPVMEIRDPVKINATAAIGFDSDALKYKPNSIEILSEKIVSKNCNLSSIEGRYLEESKDSIASCQLRFDNSGSEDVVMRLGTNLTVVKRFEKSMDAVEN